MISLTDFMMGRRELHPQAYSQDIEREALNTIKLVTQLLAEAQAAGVTLERHPRTGSLVSSGWRPPAINASTPNAAVRSLHMTGRALDVYDPDGDLDEWLMSKAGQAALTRIGLWLEHPAATKGWSHLQTVAPRSGNRVFYP